MCFPCNMASVRNPLTTNRSHAPGSVTFLTISTNSLHIYNAIRMPWQSAILGVCILMYFAHGKSDCLLMYDEIDWLLYRWNLWWCMAVPGVELTQCALICLRQGAQSVFCPWSRTCDADNNNTPWLMSAILGCVHLTNTWFRWLNGRVCFHNDDRNNDVLPPTWKGG